MIRPKRGERSEISSEVLEATSEIEEAEISGLTGWNDAFFTM